MTTASTQQVKVPEGFEFIDRKSPFSEHSGPFFQRCDEQGRQEVLGLRISSHHLNKIGVAHGGLLMTMADNAFGDAIIGLHEQPVSFVTVSMSSEFLAACHEGDWVEARVTIKRAGRRLLFADCALTVGDKTVFTASSVFMILNRQS